MAWRQYVLTISVVGLIVLLAAFGWVTNNKFVAFVLGGAAVMAIDPMLIVSGALAGLLVRHAGWLLLVIVAIGVGLNVWIIAMNADFRGDSPIPPFTYFARILAVATWAAGMHALRTTVTRSQSRIADKT